MYAGNDIVAYTHPRCVNKWQQQRFLDKVLHPKEIVQLHAQLHKDACVWTIWTLKEAAYKLSCFLGNRNKFHALQFEVTSLPVELPINDTVIVFPLKNNNYTDVHTIKSKVIYGQHIFYGHSLITPHFIHSLVTSNHSLDKDTCWGIQDHELINKDDYSAAVRQFTMLQLSQQNIHVYAIEKDVDGIPFVTLPYGEKKFISLSHDQQFVSYAYRK